MSRTQTAHYCLFQSAMLGQSRDAGQACGHDLWSFEGPDGRGLARAFGGSCRTWRLESWPIRADRTLRPGRFLPLYLVRTRQAGGAALSACRVLTAPEQCDPIYFPHDGIKPFWTLGLTPGVAPRGGTWDEFAPVLADTASVAVDLAVGKRSAETPADPEEAEARLWAGSFAIGRNGIAADARLRRREPRRGNPAPVGRCPDGPCSRAEHEDALRFASVVHPTRRYRRRRALAILRAAMP
jgi:hypothetical protein